VNTSEAAVIAAIAGAGLTRVMSYEPVPLKLRAFLDWVTSRLQARLAFGDDDR
jgi:hypothetical protein